MKLSKQLRLDIGKVLLITMSYTIINLFLFASNTALIHSSFSLGPSERFDSTQYLLINIMVGLVAGLLGGTTIVFVNSRYFRKRSFRYSLLTTALSYISIFLFINVLAVFFIAGNKYGFSALTFSVFKSEWMIVFDETFWVNFILWGFITLFTTFLLQVNDKFGPGVLFKFLMGNYHRPKEEQRIFMFMDMRSSTTIAEKIGNEKYFHLLNDIFSDLTDTILNHQGEIYQYVGDEVVISWPMKRGIKNTNFIRCFLQVQKKLEKLQPVYQKRYGLSPQFKAGIHYGTVMAGEVGVIKKDIIYSGDVLNTTSRIQEQCNEYNVDLLISKETFKLAENSKYIFKTLGNIELRGKATKVEIGTVEIR